MFKSVLIYTTSILLSLLLIIVIITSCKKNRSNLCSGKIQEKTQTIGINNQLLSGRFFDGGTKADLNAFESTESDIDGILTSYGLTLNSGDNPIGLAIFFTSTVDTTSLTVTTPTAMLVYKQAGGRIWAQLYNKTSTSWSENSSCWGITTELSISTVYDVIDNENLSVQNVVILQSDSFPDNYYLSAFEAKESPNDDGGYAGNCSSPSCGTSVKGVCVKLPKNGGYYCDPESTCLSTNLIKYLTDNSYPLPSLLVDRQYIVRDEILNQSKKRSELIDDYYYVSSIIMEEADLNLALSAYNIYNSNLLRKLANMNTTIYADTILIKTGEKANLLSFCSLAETYSTDSRYQTIIDSVTARINRFYNHTISYVNSNYQ